MGKKNLSSLHAIFYTLETLCHSSFLWFASSDSILEISSALVFTLFYLVLGRNDSQSSSTCNDSVKLSIPNHASMKRKLRLSFIPYCENFSNEKKNVGQHLILSIGNELDHCCLLIELFHVSDRFLDHCPARAYGEMLLGGYINTLY